MYYNSTRIPAAVASTLDIAASASVLVVQPATAAAEVLVHRSLDNHIIQEVADSTN